MPRLSFCAFAGAFVCTALGCGDYRPPNAQDEAIAPTANIGPSQSASRANGSDAAPNDATTDSKPAQIRYRTIAGLGEWIRCEHPADDFAFAMPGRSERSTNNLATPNGVVSVATHVLNAGEIVFLAMSTEYSDEFLRSAGLSADQVLASGLEMVISERPGAALLDRTSHEFAGLAAIDQTFSYPEGANRAGGEYPSGVMFHRALRDGNRVFLLQVDVSESHYDAHGDEVFAARRQFFDSFARKR